MISVAIITKNEEKNILDCLESVSWADEIVIVDDFSTDLTEQVVKSFKNNKNIHFYKRRLENDFSAQRNYALSKCKYEWILFIDADERVRDEFREEINTFLIRERDKSKYNGFNIPRKDVIWGRVLKHGETASISLLRLARKDKGKWKGSVHEVWEATKPIGEFENYIIHFPHQTVNEFLKEINFYSTIRAKELYNLKKSVSAWEIIAYPKAKFILNYIFKLGFLDGIEGLVFALMMSFHSFLVRAKLWLLWTKE